MRVSTNSKKQVVMGIDPGFASMGIAILERENSKIRIVSGGVFHTKKAEKKSRNNLRVTNDDVHRQIDVCNIVNEIYKQHHPFAVGVEGYRVYASGSGAKTMASYGGVIWWAATVGIHVAPFLPDDLRRRFCPGIKKSTKEDVERGVCKVVEGATMFLGRLNKTEHEHLADAIGHAVLILEDLSELRRMIGEE